MIKIYADIHKDPQFIYIEDKISSHDITCSSRDEFKAFIKDFIERYGTIHTCYSPFLNHIGRFIRDCGKRWYGQEFVVYTSEKYGGKEFQKKHRYDKSGRIVDWTLGYFD